MSAPPTLGDVLGKILEAVTTIIYQVASAVSANAELVATALVVGGITFFLIRYGARIFRGVMGWIRGLF